VSTNGLVPAFEVGGTHVAAALIDPKRWASVCARPPRAELDPLGSDVEIIRNIARCASAIGSPAGAVWGAAFPGPFDYEAGIGRFIDVAKFEALRGIDVRRALMELIEPRPADIVFIKDADAFALGEWRSGAGFGHRRVVGITLGTGVGSAFLADGNIIENASNVPPEGRVDLLRIEGRALEDTVSRRAILAAYSNLSGKSNPALDVRELSELARMGDREARLSIEGAMASLGRVLAPWLDRFGATLVVVGGSIAGSWDLISAPLWSSLSSAVPGLERRLAMVRAQHPDSAAIVGAAIRACQKGGR
jgi:predicted NBD/HSP70 family sugar kinase